MKRFLILLICLFFCGLCHTQSLSFDRRPVVFSGIVVSQDNMQPISNVTIKMYGRSRGTISNKDGRFEITVNTGDTLVFSHVSYIKSVVVVPRNLDEDRYFIVKPMTTTTIELPEVIVLPWATKEEFAKEFIAGAKHTEEVIRVKENLKVFNSVMKEDLMRAGNEAPYRNDVITTMQRENYYNGQTQPWYFLDIGTWYRFIKKINK